MCCRFGSVGMYSVAFFSVLRAFFMVFIFFSILIAAFAISYHALYHTMIFPDDPEFYDLTVYKLLIIFYRR